MDINQIRENYIVVRDDCDMGTDNMVKFDVSDRKSVTSRHCSIRKYGARV